MCWQFWLDVGGTFTDCLARAPDGRSLRRKVLSSGVSKGSVLATFQGGLLVEGTEPFPDDFWAGYALRAFGSDGQALGESEVTSSAWQLGGLRLETLGRDWPPHARRYELLSPEEAPLLAIRLFLGLRLDEPIPNCAVRLGTTRGTNALLTRQGARTGFVTTRGFGDVLAIGYQNRPRLFELAIHKPEPLYALVAEIDERVGHDGTVLLAARDEQICAALKQLLASGIESLAICLLNAYANPAHERQVERLARGMGFEEVSVSSQVSPLMKIVPRGDTTVADAYLNPVLRSYIARLSRSLGGSDLRLMTSAGGLAAASGFSGKDSILSGPAGGVIGFSRVAEAAGFAKAIGFDMGGTSTDVARYDGRYEYEHETQKAGVRIVAPMLAIETVAAGGGSLCRFDGVKLVVGPESAGAEPGPACYGRGGPLTVTDCNLLLGRVVAERFPFPLDRAAAEERLAELAKQVDRAAAGEKSGTAMVPLGSEVLCTQYSVPSTQFAGVDFQQPTSQTTHHSLLTTHLPLAAGFLRIANANMAQAIRSISLAKGYDPRDYTLVAFGSAGPQHACAVARELGIRSVLLHPDAGVLSALGMGLADIVKHRAAGIYRPYEACCDELPNVFRALEAQARQDLLVDDAGTADVEVRRELDLRYQGTDAALTVAEPPSGDFAGAFAAEHKRRYGYVHEGRALEAVAARVQAIGRCPMRLPRSAAESGQTAVADRTHLLFSGGRFQAVGLFDRECLAPGAVVAGPAVIVEPLTTTIVDPGWRASVLSGGELLLTDMQSDPAATPSHSTPTLEPADPVLLEVLSNHFTAIATQMGITLRNTSMSVNVKERLDFSCAIFTADGDLVVNAPHIPVHLGAMAMTVKSILADNPDMRPGDVFVTNDPYRGGSHLPDVTVVTPVFGQREDTDGTRSVPATYVRFFTASRAHHAEIGGMTPGSMPPFSKSLAKEGVLIRNFQLVTAGQPRFDELRELLLSGAYPSRDVDANLADVTAQVAANRQGANDLARLNERFSWPVVEAYMRHLQAAAERKLRTALSKLPPGRRQFVDHLDDGTPICATITIDGERATIDFTGTGAVSSGNLNANRSIVTAAVIYVLRLLVGEEVPLNQGLLAPIELVLPECLLNPPAGQRPEVCPAVVGGNVETSQRVVDVLLGAFGLAAASQGTMNNVLFGDASFGYYETICGGSGATASGGGADAVHTHMTNTRITDPEVLEARYPVRLLEFSIRRGSGGAGSHRGGDGAVRRIEFLTPLTLSILSQRRAAYPPYGMWGGEPGACGRNRLLKADGSEWLLDGMTQIRVEAGDVLAIETPGGGGWGASQIGRSSAPSYNPL